MNMLKVESYFSVSLQQLSHSSCHITLTCDSKHQSLPLIHLSAVVNLLNINTLENMARNFTAYPTVAPKVRVYGDMVFKFNPSSFTSKSGKQ